MQTEFGIHHRLESCAKITKVGGLAFTHPTPLKMTGWVFILCSCPSVCRSVLDVAVRVSIDPPAPIVVPTTPGRLDTPGAVVIVGPPFAAQGQDSCNLV